MFETHDITRFLVAVIIFVEDLNVKKMQNISITLPIELLLKLEKNWKKTIFNNRSQYIVDLIRKGLENE